VAEAPRPSHGLIDTSVVTALENIDAGQLPSKLAISAPTTAEFTAGSHATGDAGERARRQDPYNEPRLNLVKRRGGSCVIGSGH
jgi:hypothetical protein